MRVLLPQPDLAQLIDALEEAPLDVDELTALQLFGNIVAGRLLRDDVGGPATQFDELLGRQDTAPCVLPTTSSSSSSVANWAPNSWLSTGAHSSSTMNSARIRSTKPAASFAVALVSSGAKTVAMVSRSWR